jgi:SAM-dependent methyltransferase
MKQMLRLFDFKNMFLSVYHKAKNHGYFDYDELRLKPFIHWYNHTWDNSRQVEIPIFFEVMKRCDWERILEVGNVLSHYIPTMHDVLDKYEKAPGVINEDIITYKPFLAELKYDVVLSISTLEHVGFDEENKDPDGFIKAINNIKNNILAPGGVLIFSVPIGYNPGLDKALRENMVRLDSVTHYSQDGWHIIIGVIQK